MAEWHVSESESEGEGVCDGSVELGSLRIPPHRLAELLQTIETRKTLDLECLAGGGVGPGSAEEGRRRRERRRKHKRRKKKSEEEGGRDSRAQEEVSETASELRSTASTDTTPRDGKWCVYIVNIYNTITIWVYECN